MELRESAFFAIRNPNGVSCGNDLGLAGHCVRPRLGTQSVCPSRACAVRLDDRDSIPPAWRHTSSGGRRLVPTSFVGLASGRGSHRRAGHRKDHQSFSRPHRRRCDGFRHRYCAPRLSPASSRQNCFSLKKFHERLEVNLLKTLLQAMSTVRPVV